MCAARIAARAARGSARAANWRNVSGRRRKKNTIQLTDKHIFQLMAKTLPAQRYNKRKENERKAYGIYALSALYSDVAYGAKKKNIIPMACQKINGKASPQHACRCMSCSYITLLRFLSII